MGNAYGHLMHNPDGYFSRLVEGPAVPLLTTAEAKDHLRVYFTDDDALIDAYVSAATDMLDAEFGELGRALVTQRWELVLDGFPADGRIVLPIPPVQQVVSLTYYDADNAQQTFDPLSYRLTANGEFAVVDLVEGAIWPATYNRADAVTVTYSTGYGDTAADVPEGIRMAARMLVAHFYATREAVTEKGGAEMPLGVRYLLMKYRVVRGHI